MGLFTLVYFTVRQHSFKTHLKGKLGGEKWLHDKRVIMNLGL